MSEETDGAMGSPPSFMPAAGRKKSASQSAAGASSSARGVGQKVPSFSPASKPSRTSSRQSSAKQTSRTTGTSSGGTPVEASAGDAPRSFRPSSRPSRPSRSSSNISGARGAQSPAAFPPPAKQQPRRVRQSSSALRQSPKATKPQNNVRQRPATTPGISSYISRAGNLGKGMRGGVGAAHKTRNIGKIILCSLLALLLAFGLSVFCTWNWIDGQLNKTSWLTSKANTSGESWLILGSDERDGTVGDTGDITGFRTDTILVLTKPESGPSSLISIPRDSLVEIDQTYMKINAVAQLYDGKQLVNEVEDITGQKIDHVAMVQFGGLINVVDALGGVELCYDQDVDDPYSGLTWSSGCHTVDGNTALAFSRMRYADAQGDFGRAARQRQVISAIVKKGASRQTLLNFGKVKKVAESALGSVTVDENASTSSLLHMALAFKSASSDDGISGSVYWTDPDYYVDGVGSSVLLDNERNLQLFSELADGTHEAGTVGTLAEQQ